MSLIDSMRNEAPMYETYQATPLPEWEGPTGLATLLQYNMSMERAQRGKTTKAPEQDSEIIRGTIANNQWFKDKIAINDARRKILKQNALQEIAHNQNSPEELDKLTAKYGSMVQQIDLEEQELKDKWKGKMNDHAELFYKTQTKAYDQKLVDDVGLVSIGNEMLPDTRKGRLVKVGEQLNYINEKQPIFKDTPYGIQVEEPEMPITDYTGKADQFIQNLYKEASSHSTGTESSDPQKNDALNFMAIRNTGVKHNYQQIQDATDYINSRIVDNKEANADMTKRFANYLYTKANIKAIGTNMGGLEGNSLTDDEIKAIEAHKEGKSTDPNLLLNAKKKFILGYSVGASKMYKEYNKTTNLKGDAEGEGAGGSTTVPTYEELIINQNPEVLGIRSPFTYLESSTSIKTTRGVPLMDEIKNEISTDPSIKKAQEEVDKNPSLTNLSTLESLKTKKLREYLKYKLDKSVSREEIAKMEMSQNGVTRPGLSTGYRYASLPQGGYTSYTSTEDKKGGGYLVIPNEETFTSNPIKAVTITKYPIVEGSNGYDVYNGTTADIFGEKAIMPGGAVLNLRDAPGAVFIDPKNLGHGYDDPNGDPNKDFMAVAGRIVVTGSQLQKIIGKVNVGGQWVNKELATKGTVYGSNLTDAGKLLGVQKVKELDEWFPTEAKKNSREYENLKKLQDSESGDEDLYSIPAGVDGSYLMIENYPEKKTKIYPSGNMPLNEDAQKALINRKKQLNK